MTITKEKIQVEEVGFQSPLEDNNDSLSFSPINVATQDDDQEEMDNNRDNTKENKKEDTKENPLETYYVEFSNL